MRQSVIPILTGLSFWMLAGGGASAVELPAEAVAALAAQKFAERESGQDRLLEWARRQPKPGPAMDELLKQSRVATDPEVRERCLAVLKELVSDEYLREGEGYLGVELLDEIVGVPGEAEPRQVIRVVRVEAKSPADRGGLRANDAILAVNWNGWKALPEAELRKDVRNMKPATTVKLRLLRGEKISEVEVVLRRRPRIADNPFPEARPADFEAGERAEKEADFKRWLDARKDDR